MDAFHHRALILPRDHTKYISECNFAALGSQGRWGHDTRNGWGYGLLWFGGSLWDSVAVNWHELGHNVGQNSKRISFTAHLELGCSHLPGLELRSSHLQMLT